MATPVIARVLPERITANTSQVRSMVGPGRVIYAVIKADGYGLGARIAAEAAIAGGADGFYSFDLAEATGDADLKRFGKPIIAIDHPWRGYSAGDYREAKVRPIVSSVARAEQLASERPVLSIDTGMRRFGCDAADVPAALRAGRVDEVMTHGVRLEHAAELVRLAGDWPCRKHAAGTALLGEPGAWLDAVRPGMALYRGAVRVTSTVVEARDTGTTGRAGYGQFAAGRVGVILGGYTQSLRAGVCLVRGERRRVLEVGMQSAYVELKPGEGAGEEVVLLGDGLTEAEVATAWGVSEQEVLVRMGRNRG